MTDLVLRNVAPFGGPTVDVALTDGVVTAIVDRFDGLATEEIECGGRWMIPGLWDEHVHTNLWAISTRRLDLSSVSSAAEAVRRIAEALSTSTDEVFVAVNYRDALWPDRLSVAALDAVSGNRPVLLISGDVHGSWLNSAGLQRFGVTAHDDGRIAEDEAFRVQVLANQIDDAVLDDWVADALRNAAARGVTGIVDFEMRDSAPDWVRRSDAGLMSTRVEASVYRAHLDDAIADGRATGRILDRRSLVRAGYFKSITDGSLGTRTAWCSHPYPDGSFGAANVNYDELRADVARAHSAGIVPAIHAIGDRANHAVLNVFEELGIGGRLEHAQQVQLDDVPRFASLGVVASVQPEHAMDDRDAAEQLWGRALEGAYLLRSLQEAGAVLAFGSDAPVARLDPWHAIASAVWRSRDGREPWRSTEALTLREAIAASTRSAQIAVGMTADLVVLDRDPSRATVDELRELPVALTLLGGVATHRAI